MTMALSHEAAVLARELSGHGKARDYGLNWKSVATMVKTGSMEGSIARGRPCT